MSEVRYCANPDCRDSDGNRTVIPAEQVRRRPTIKACCPACKQVVHRLRKAERANGAGDVTGQRRGGGPRGADMPWRRSVVALAAGLLALDRLPETDAEAAALAERLLAPALNAKQAARVGLTSVGVAGREAPPGDDEIAKRIARAHNAIRNAASGGGVLAFSDQARSVWPLADGDEFGLPIDRLPFPIHERDVEPAEVAAWLTDHRAWQYEAYEQREQDRLDAHARGEIRRGERDRNYGMATGSANCASCGALKSRPSAQCTLCGDIPHAGDADTYDRAHGYAADAARAA